MGDERDTDGGSSRPADNDGYEIIATRRIKKNYYEVVLAQARADARELRSHGHGVPASSSPGPSIMATPRSEVHAPAQSFVPVAYQAREPVSVGPSGWAADSDLSDAGVTDLLEAPVEESSLIDVDPVSLMPEALTHEVIDEPELLGGAHLAVEPPIIDDLFNDDAAPALTDLSEDSASTSATSIAETEAPDTGAVATAEVESLTLDGAATIDWTPPDVAVDSPEAPPSLLDEPAVPAPALDVEPAHSPDAFVSVESPHVESVEAVEVEPATEIAPDEEELTAQPSRVFSLSDDSDDLEPPTDLLAPDPTPVPTEAPAHVDVTSEPGLATSEAPEAAPEEWSVPDTAVDKGISPEVAAASAALVAKVSTTPERPRETIEPSKKHLFGRGNKDATAVDTAAVAAGTKSKPAKAPKPDKSKAAKPTKSKSETATHAKGASDDKKGFFTLSLRKEKKVDPEAAAARSATAAVTRARSAAARPRVTIDPKTGLPVHSSSTTDAAGSMLPAVPGAVSMAAPSTSKRGSAEAGAPRETRVRNEFQDYLIRNSIVSDVQLDEAFERHLQTGHSLFEALDELGIIDEERIASAVATFYDLSQCDLPREELEPSAFDLVPESIARENMVFPIQISPEGLYVAVAEPSERIAALLTQASGHPVVMTVAKASDIRWAIDSNYHALVGVAELVEEFEADESPRRRQQMAAQTTTTEIDSADNAPIVQVVNRILSQAMRDGASDVHIEPADDIVRVRNRVDGVLKVVLVLPAAMGLGLVSRIKIMADMNIVERRRPQDGKFTATVDGREIDVRVATVATIWGETCVLRILDKTRSVLGIDDLGMAPDTHEKYSKMIRSPFGMVLCVGPTGSGKTTTLYASLTEISDSARNVMTIEDPVEYVFPSINQIQTNEAAGLTFATGLKSILRQDSDIVLVGEIRDVETAQIAVQSTLTGHFVLSSLHATDAISALTRFIDMGIESFLIASAVNAIVGQRLVRRICTACKTPYTPTDEELAFYQRSGGPDKEIFYHGAGCNFCGHTGFKDRIGVYELFEMTPEMKRLIVGFATEDELRDLARKQGMRTIQDEAVDLVARDITTSAEVVRSIYSL